MKKFILVPLLISVMSLTSCSFVQLFEVNSLNLDNSEEYLQFENDSLKIIYDFFSEGGSMSFLIINKMKVPIYIDWRKSAFILNNDKNNYWAEVTTSKTKGRNINISMTDFSDKTWGLSDIGLSTYTTISETPERITFIPPVTALPKNKFKIFSQPTYSFERNSTFQMKKVNNINVEFEKYTLDESPVTFRNFLTFSTTEQFESEFYIDDGFFIQYVRQFRSKLLNRMTSPKSFYIYNKSNSSKNNHRPFDPIYDQ